MTSESNPTFYGLGIAPKLLEILERNKFTIPTPIQVKAIPVAIEGKDVIGIAQTGTGKTLAFGIPMIQNLARTKGQGLVLLPTKELAQQAEEMLMHFGRAIGLRVVVVVGGASMQHQVSGLRNNPHIIIATPGRLIDHLQHRPSLLEKVRVLILDEADRMLDMGFAPQINKILARVPRERQTMLFSATMPSAIVSIAQQHMALPVRVEIARPGTTVDQVDQEVIFVAKNNKLTLLQRTLARYQGSVLVFTRTKWGARKLARDVRNMGHTAAELHANRSLGQRREAFEGFKSGAYRVLVATDIAARGIDVKNIELVINYDLPGTPEDYVHRIGRTARAGSSGRAISFAMPDQQRDIRDIERLIRMQLPVAKESPLPLPEQSHLTSRPHWSGRPHRPPRHPRHRSRRTGRSPRQYFGP